MADQFAIIDTYGKWFPFLEV